MRQNWDHYFMDIAFKVSSRGTCPRLKVGAVLVKDKRIKSTGYNGSPPQLPHCEDEGCHMHNNHCIRTSHAEANALNEADTSEKKGATLYVTDQPCQDCQKLILSAGIKKVVYARPYKPDMNWFSLSSELEVLHLEDYKIPVEINEQEQKDIKELIKKIEEKLSKEESEELRSLLDFLKKKLK